MNLVRLLQLALVLLLASETLAADRGSAPPSNPETFRIASAPGSPLFVLLRHLPPAPGVERKESPVLLVHGATFPSALAAAYRLHGRSWMDDLAAHGFDTWALDFLGYGGSDRYVEMNGPPDAHPPLGRAPAAAVQIEAAVAFITGNTGSSRVSLVAHSWGTLPAGRFAAMHGERVARLVLFGPIVDRSGTGRPSTSLPAYQDVTGEDQRENFDTGVPAGVAVPFSADEFGAWASAYLGSDTGKALRLVPAVRVPFGPMADSEDAHYGVLPYDPAAIGSPTLIVRGEWDAVATAADAERLFGRLGASLRRSVVVSRGTHRMHLEPSRGQLFDEVDAFLAGDDHER